MLIDVTGLLTTVALTALITDAIKDGIGRPRPHFYARCFGSPLAKPVSSETDRNSLHSSLKLGEGIMLKVDW